MNNNQVIESIELHEQLISNSLKRGVSTREEFDELHKTLDMNLEEFVRLHELKSLAFIEENLGLEEAQIIFELLGNSPEHFNLQSLATKITLTRIFRGLLERLLNLQTFTQDNH